MKKIVALVLSLVMALSLCTVAFGVNGTELYSLNANKNADKVVQDGGIDSVKAKTDKNGGGWVAYYVRENYEKLDSYVYTLGGEKYWTPVDEAYGWSVEKRDEIIADGGEFILNAAGDAWAIEKHTYYFGDTYLIPCEQDVADYAIHKNGSFVEFVFEAETAAAAHYDVVAATQKATTAKPNCTTSQFFYDGYLCDDGCHFYVEKPTAGAFEMAKLNVNGKIVVAYDVSEDTDYVVWASHIFAKGVENTKTGYDVATCLICKGEFACTNNDAVATKNGYKVSTGFAYSAADAAKVYNENKYDNGYDFAWGQTYAGDYAFCWQLKAGTTEEIGTATETKTEGVESAKTFDAGIAMYVGMSLMSVAGTAVVIGKKKEF